MKRSIALILITATFSFFSYSLAFAFNSGSTGALGAYNPQTDAEVQLPTNGKLNYTSVNIPANVTVTFIKNATNTPVYILATGDVTIAGTINVTGVNANGMYPGQGGPGGFDGGLGGTPVNGSNPALPGGRGLGIGGGNPGSVPSVTTNSSAGGGGGFGSDGLDGSGHPTYAPGGTGGSAYGNLRIVPMTGGSGGGGGAGSVYASYPRIAGGGGGGGGAILIAASGTITISGNITANGGAGGNGSDLSAAYAGCGGGGAGGAIKLMADTITGEGTISATKGAGGATNCNYHGGNGGDGRIRLEANTIIRTSPTSPVNTFSNPGQVFLTNNPTLTITSIGGANVPTSPIGKYGVPDITLPSGTSNPVTITVTGTNIPDGTAVTVTSVPEYGPATSSAGTLNGNDTSSTASVAINLSITYQCILTVQATYSVQTAMYYNGERIEKIRVASTIGRESETVYITEKGRELKGAEVLAMLVQ